LPAQAFKKDGKTALKMADRPVLHETITLES
jgi:hypothetical protein